MKDIIKSLNLKEEQAIDINIDSTLRVHIRKNDTGYSVDVFDITCKKVQDGLLLDELQYWYDDFENIE